MAVLSKELQLDPALMRLLNHHLRMAHNMGFSERSIVFCHNLDEGEEAPDMTGVMRQMATEEWRKVYPEKSEDIQRRWNARCLARSTKACAARSRGARL